MASGVNQLFDRLTGSSRDASKWNSTVGGTTTVTYDGLGVHVNLPTPTTASDLGNINSVNQYDLTGRAATIHVTSIPAAATAADFRFALLASGSENSRIQWITESGNLQAQQFIPAKTNIGSQQNGIKTDIWLRIAELAGTTYFSASYDGINFGYYQTSTANPIVLTSVQVKIEVNTFQAETNAIGGSWRNFNMIDVAAPDIFSAVRTMPQPRPVLPWAL
jgi:hypothetical protein